MEGRALDRQIERGTLRTPHAAGVAGIIFAVLLAATLVLMYLGTPTGVDDVAVWLDDGARRTAVVVALQLVPFAGIAFLWFIGVIRSRIGDGEDRFLATVLLGSGLILVAMLFVSSAIAGGLYASLDASDGASASEVWEFGRRTTLLITTVYALRMAAVFMISTTTIAWKLGVIPRWLMALGYAFAVLLLLTSGAVRWVELLFPLWVLLLSIHLLRLPSAARAALTEPTDTGADA
jgi:hypothetical protein